MATAVIVEPRRHAALSFVLHNFIEMLPNDWKILIMHGMENKEYVENILSKFPADRFLPCIQMNVSNLTIQDYNVLLTSTHFYESIPTEIILVFQTDTLILESEQLDSFLKYDYVGAPWTNGVVGNGGLSLRKKSRMIDICQRAGPSRDANEDGFFCITNGESLYLPTSEEAKLFSVETVFYHHPFGIHSPWKHLRSEEMTQLISRYPAIQTLINLQRTDTI